MEFTGFRYLVWTVISVNIILANLVHSYTYNFSIGFMSPLDSSLGPTSQLGQEFASAYKLAIVSINEYAKQNQSRIRLSTDFKNLIKDEGSNPSKNCMKEASNFHKNNNIVGIVGAFTSSCTISIQKQLVLSGSKLSQISYGSTIPELSSKTKYPRLFRTCPSDINQAQALADLLKHFRWRTIGVIGVDDAYGKGIIDNFLSRANNHGILIKERGRFMPNDGTSVIGDELQKLKNAGTRINLIVANGQKVMEILKEAKKKKMIGEGWVWLGSDRVSATWLGSDEELKEAAEGLVSISPIIPTGSKLLEVIIKWFGHTEYPGIVWNSSEPSVSPYVAEVYDALFAYYYALDALAKRQEISLVTPIDVVRQLVFTELKKFKDEASGFEGLAGNPVYFDVDGNTLDPPGRYDFLNYKDRFNKPVGNWSETSSGILLRKGIIVWPGGTKVTPTDRGSPGKPLFKIGFVSPTNKGLGILGDLGQELLSAFKVAVSIINAGKDYHVELDMKIYDEGIDGRKSCEDVAHNLIHDGVTVVVGAYRSECSIVLSKILGSQSHRIPIISYGSSSAVLSNKKEHKYFFRVIPSAVYQAKALQKFVKKYSFSEVGAIFADNLQSKEVASDFVKEMNNKSIPVTIYAQVRRNSNAFAVRQIIRKVKDSGSNVNIISALARDAEAIYQQMKELSMVGKGWVMFSNTDATATSFTSSSTLQKALHGLVGLAPKAGEGSLYLGFLSKWLKDPTTFPGIVHTHADTAPKSMPYTTQVLDSVNGIASALSHLVVKKSISYNTNPMIVRTKLYERLKEYSELANGFPSASGLGSIYFDENQDGPAVYDIVNMVDSSWKTIGTYSGLKDKLTLSQDPIFPGGLTIPIVGSGKSMYKIAGIFPRDFSLGPLADLGAIWERAFKVAAIWVNRNQSLKVGFHYVTYDGGPDEKSCANVAKTLPNDVQLVVGEARSACTRAVYKNIHPRGIPMITYASTSSLLESKASYPNLFRICANDRHQVAALTRLIEKFNWDKIGIIASDNTYGRGMSGHLKGKLEENSVRIVELQKFPADETTKTPVQLLTLKNAGAGVNVVISPTSDVERVFQEAFEEGMTGRGWTWIGSDGATSATFAKSHHLRNAMQGMVGFGPKRGQGKVFDNIMKNWDPDITSKKRQIPYIAQIFDSVLAAATSLDRLHRKKRVTEATNHTRLRHLITEELRKMNSPATGFDGTTGVRTFFDQHQDGQPKYDLLNLNGDSWVKVGSFDKAGLKITSNVIWSGGTVKTPPSDPPSKPVDPKGRTKSLGTGLVILSVIFSIFGVLVLLFMIYIIRRVRYRHLYMQSDAASGGLFSVLYGHRQNHSFRGVQGRVMHHSNNDTFKDTELNDLPQYTVPRNA